MNQNSIRLTAALRDLRPKAQGDGGLWLSLLKEMALTEVALAALLREEHGVEVILDDGRNLLRETDADTPQAIGVWISHGGRVLLLCEDPWKREAMQAIGRRVGAGLAMARPGQLRAVSTATSAPKEVSKPEVSVASVGFSDSQVVPFVDDAIARAYREGASDIHFETNRKGVGIKYRLDGVMASGERLDDPQRAEEVVSRIKVMAQLDITERRKPQDGRIHWVRPGHDPIDLRASIMPSIFGEDAVLRLLDKAQLRQNDSSMSLDALGFDPAVALKLRSLATRPHGMLLVTGPTGSGKTTTTYAALSEANTGLEKIITIEDPVEYELPGVLQIPVNEQKGLTFATGLRSILRHDPDKILVGEIRDAETAEIAVQSSLTGHLVLTTVHANSLFDVLGRFQHFGIDPFALASAINGVVVQRLLRKICPVCMTWHEPTDAEIALYCSNELEPPARLPQAHGCDKCRQTGYKGRFVVAEIHELDDEMRDLFVNKTSMSELKKRMYRDNAVRLLSHALNNVKAGVTTLEEVERVVGLV